MFKDEFSGQASIYAKYRPKYPEGLFEYLSSLCSNHNLAWDCATGNGQAALGLVSHFDSILATDASSEQIKHAFPHPKITYKVKPASDSDLSESSVDLVTVATALHWLDTDSFYSEVKRVLKPSGIIAVWTYADSVISGEIDKLTFNYAHEILGKSWDPYIKRAWSFDKLIDFPFNKIITPEFHFEQLWSFEDFINYLYTWSGTQNYIKKINSDPVDLIREELIKLWGTVKRMVRWDLVLKAGSLFNK